MIGSVLWPLWLQVPQAARRRRGRRGRRCATPCGATGSRAFRSFIETRTTRSSPGLMERWPCCAPPLAVAGVYKSYEAHTAAVPMFCAFASPRRAPPLAIQKTRLRRNPVTSAIVNPSEFRSSFRGKSESRGQAYARFLVPSTGSELFLAWSPKIFGCGLTIALQEQPQRGNMVP